MDPAVELLTDSSELSSADYPVLKLIKPSFSTGIGNTIDRIYRMNKWNQHNLNDTFKLWPDILKPEILYPVTGKWIVSPVEIQGHYRSSWRRHPLLNLNLVLVLPRKWVKNDRWWPWKISKNRTAGLDGT